MKMNKKSVYKSFPQL